MSESASDGISSSPKFPRLARVLASFFLILNLADIVLTAIAFWIGPAVELNLFLKDVSLPLMVAAKLVLMSFIYVTFRGSIRLTVRHNVKVARGILYVTLGILTVFYIEVVGSGILRIAFFLI